MEHFGASKKFFDSWRSDCVIAMTLIDELTEGTLYYYESPFSCDVWVVVGPHSVMVAYPAGERDLDEIRKRVAIWGQALTAGVVPSRFGEAGHPVYGAKEAPNSGQVLVAWYWPGDWCGLVMHLPLRRAWHQLPREWPDGYRDRITQLAARRSGGGKERRDA